MVEPPSSDVARAVHLAEPSSLFGPTTFEPLVISPTRKEVVHKATPTFLRWAGESPGSDYGGKQILDFQGQPPFAELAILGTVQAAGWDGVWVTHAGRREKHRRGFWGLQAAFELPSGVLGFLQQMRSSRGETSRGTWDVLCWPRDVATVAPANLRSIESKRGGHDALSVHQLDWFRSARDAGVPREAFLIVEWTLGRRGSGSI
jgi:hypothetical protein